MSFDFKKGFTIYCDSDKQRMFPEEWLYNDEYSDKNRSVYQAYDANLFPLPDIKSWPKHSIEETCRKVSAIFKTSNKKIYLDGYLLDTETHTLSKHQLGQ